MQDVNHCREKENLGNVQPSSARKAAHVSFSTPSKAAPSFQIQRSFSERKPGQLARADARTPLKGFQSQLPEASVTQSASKVSQRGGRSEACHEEEEFSRDVGSLAEILEGEGIAEHRIPTVGKQSMYLSVQELRELREKRSSIFKGPLRVVKTSKSATASFRQSMAARESFLVPRNAATPKRLSSMTPGSADKQAPLSAGAGAGVRSVDRRTPAGKEEGRSLCHAQRSLNFARAEMTPSNSRARSVAGVIGSLLKDKSATPSRKVALDLSKCDEETELSSPVPQLQLGESKEKESYLPDGGGLLLQEDRSAMETEGGGKEERQVKEEMEMKQPDENAKEQNVDVLGTVQVEAPGTESFHLSAQSAAVLSCKEQAASKQLVSEERRGSRPRSRKSILLQESRRRCGVKSPKKRATSLQQVEDPKGSSELTQVEEEDEDFIDGEVCIRPMHRTSRKPFLSSTPAEDQQLGSPEIELGKVINQVGPELGSPEVHERAENPKDREHDRAYERPSAGALVQACEASGGEEEGGVWELTLTYKE
ncbi:hypothetical protein GUITHDRAFT_109832 [Guillardia theta CCMP2712]|uniref:Uncharacterized protein n=1 Tax=Guillardia theta (strain CCMP2712) TaxID=905079 RepID=L1J8F3_GUITC|nr:hypothetical protein GUITHDRAFT_109832 [Guillardia theta CCMP2712]EKX44384.1 hypothetical protein GUITHDRAFT_109832 [Guillardia theta CCMP2712]|eukprot:XP_005831364.1 hypothetical protein GUITHDRAFT_109832 [Guillardia theta CCMP2712]